MSESKVITGHALAMVKMAEPEGGEVPVRRGEALPDGIKDGEIERLTKLGAFDPPPVANLAAQGARPAFAAVPEVRPVTTDLPPRGDLATLPLPPQVTLAANPEPEDAKSTKAAKAGQGAGGSAPSGS